MNCRDAENQIIASRDTPLGAADAAVLEQHLAECHHCRSLSAQLKEAAKTWQERDASVAVPNALNEWHAVRRRIRNPASRTVGGELPSWNRLLRWALPIAAAFAIMINFLPESPPSSSRVPIASDAAVVAHHDWSEFDDHFTHVAHAEYVETDNEDISPFVYVDEESGWLIVWASEVPDHPSI
ncbi:MAG: hypothetical protein SynsKO_10650 [Synoicihabitans sp.]